MAVALAMMALAGCRDTRPAVEDPLEGVPLTQQRTITQSDLGYKWPFTVGAGTIACDGGALFFRAGGTTYALSQGAGTRGYANVNAIRRVQGSGPPSDPVSRITQDLRMKLFARRPACGAAADAVSRANARRASASAIACRRPSSLSIEAEGVERNWPPLDSRPDESRPGHRRRPVSSVSQ